MKKIKYFILGLVATMLVACGPGSNPTVDPTETPTEEPTVTPTETPTEPPTETPSNDPTKPPLQVFEVSHTSFFMAKGESVSFSISVENYTVAIDDPTIVEVDVNSNIVKGLENGHTNITFECENYESYTIPVSVQDAVYNLDGVYNGKKGKIEVGVNSIYIDEVPYTITGRSYEEYAGNQFEHIYFVDDQMNSYEFFAHQSETYAGVVASLVSSETSEEFFYMPSISSLTGAYSYYDSIDEYTVVYLIGDYYDKENEAYFIGQATLYSSDASYLKGFSSNIYVDGKKVVKLDILDSSGYSMFSLHYNEETGALYDDLSSYDTLYSNATFFLFDFYTDFGEKFALTYDYAKEAFLDKESNEFKVSSIYSSETGYSYKLTSADKVYEIKITPFGYYLSDGTTTKEYVIQTNEFSYGTVYYVSGDMRAEVEFSEEHLVPVVTLTKNGSIIDTSDMNFMVVNHKLVFATEDFSKFIEFKYLKIKVFVDQTYYYLVDEIVYKDKLSGSLKSIVEGSFIQFDIDSKLVVSSNMYEETSVGTIYAFENYVSLVVETTLGKTSFNYYVFDKVEYFEAYLDNVFLGYFYNDKFLDIESMFGNYTSNGIDSLQFGERLFLNGVDAGPITLTLKEDSPNFGITPLYFTAQYVEDSYFEYYGNNITGMDASTNKMLVNYIPLSEIEAHLGSTYVVDGKNGIESFTLDEDYVLTERYYNEKGVLYENSYEYTLMMLPYMNENVPVILMQTPEFVVYLYLYGHQLVMMGISYVKDYVREVSSAYVYDDKFIYIDINGTFMKDGYSINVSYSFDKETNTVAVFNKQTDELIASIKTDPSTNEKTVEYNNGDGTTTLFTDTNFDVLKFVGTYEDPLVGTVTVKRKTDEITGIKGNIILETKTMLVSSFMVTMKNGKPSAYFTDYEYDYYLFFTDGVPTLLVEARSVLPPPPPPPPLI